MSWVSEVKEICGDYCIDIKYHEEQTEAITLFFNSCRNAETVKRCIEDDDSIPNVATAVDFVEVVRCKDCKHATFYVCKNDACYRGIICEYQIGTDDENFFCSYGERRTDDGNL